MNNLALLRIKKGLSQETVAKQVGISRFSLIEYEKSRRSPTLDVSQRLASFFNVSVDELLNGPAQNEWKINIYWEVDEMQTLDIKKDEFAVGFRDSGDIMLWGSIPSDKTIGEASERIIKELSAAMAGRDARVKALKEQEND
jgi:transcriptional regulator with XRE-family HTH domain